MYIVNEPPDTLVSIRVESNNDAAVAVIDAYGDPVIYVDDWLSGVESGSGMIEVEAPHFVVVSQYTEGPGIFRVSSNRRLVLYDDPDDGREIALGQTVAGALDYPTDIDFFVVNLAAGESVEISVSSVLVDPLVTIDFTGATAEQLATDDDSGGGIFGLDSRIEYTALRSGTFFIVIEDAIGTDVGGYFLTVAPGESVTSAAAPAKQIFRRLWPGPVTLDPHLVADTASHGVVAEVFSGLVALNAEMEIIPDIAERWEISEGGLVYTFHLRPDVQFHNGRRVSALDFQWSLERALDSSTGSPVALTFLGDIVGVDEYMNGATTGISGVNVLGEHPLEITIDAPKRYFPAKLTHPVAYVLDRETVETGGPNWWASNPIGTGPFMLGEYRRGELIVLERNRDYYRVHAGLDTVVMSLAGGQSTAMYENDEIDIATLGIFDRDRILDPGYLLSAELSVAPPGFEITYIGFNASRAPFDDRRFRQALNYAVDKELISDEVLAGIGVPAYGILPPGFPGYSPGLEGLRYNPDPARQLLGESAYPDPLT